MAWFNTAVVIVLALACCVAGVKWSDCGTKNVKSVQVSGCESTDVCILTKGQNVSFTVDFTSPAAADKATVVVHGIIAGIPAPFPLDDTDGCKNKGLTCPVAKDTEYTYHQAILVKPEYPSISVEVKWEVQDPSSKTDLFCVLVPAKISSSSSKTAVKDPQTLYWERL